MLSEDVEFEFGIESIFFATLIFAISSGSKIPAPKLDLLGEVCEVCLAAVDAVDLDKLSDELFGKIIVAEAADFFF
jgi:hypothetical protein